MKISSLSGPAMAVSLAIAAGAPAEAGQFKKRGFFKAGGAKGVVVRRAPRTRPKQLSGHRRRSASPATFGTIQAMTVYLQWRKCLDNILPECP